jgi:hypothetical protein
MRPRGGNRMAVMKTLRAACALMVLLVPTPAHAWGYEAHQFIMDRAIALLPPEIRPFFETYRSTLVEHVIDPDAWQIAGFDDQEDANHFLDIDWDGFGPYPFAGLPRDYDAAVQKFGVARVRQMGLLPWRTAEYFGNLQREFGRYQTRGPFGRYNIIFFSAWMTHYVSDANQPLHTVMNYDGQLSGQQGVHTRFEAMLFEQNRARLQIAPRPLPAVSNPRDFTFDTIVEGTALVSQILDADRAAIGARDVYDDAYYESFYQGAHAVLEQRLSRAIAASAAMIAGAWEAAGKPALPLTLSEPVQRRRR